MIDAPSAKKIAALLAAVGEPTRMLVLHQLTDGPQNVGQLAKQVGIPMVNMSHHLGVLRQAGLLENSKKGRQVIYSLNPEFYSSGGAPDAIGTFQFGTYKLVIVTDGDSAGGDDKKRSGRKKPSDGTAVS